MCLPGQAPPVPATAADAAAMAQAALGWLAAADAAIADDGRAGGLPARAGAGRVDAHRGAGPGAGGVHRPGRVRGRRAGHGARTWLKWQTRITGGAAAGAVGWVRRLAAHPAVR